MFKRPIAFLLMLAFALGFARSTHAFIDAPYLTPIQPHNGERVSINLRAGMCDGIGSIPGYPQVSQNGNAIRIVLWSSSNSDPILCNFPVGTSTYAVGNYPAGSYTLQVDRQYLSDLGSLLTETLATIPFVVTGASGPPAPAPTLGYPGLVILGIGLSVAVAGALRCRRLNPQSRLRKGFG